MYVRRTVRRYRPSARGGPERPPERVYVSYAVVSSYRDEQGRPRQRTVVSLGPHPSVAAALEALEAERDRLAALIGAPAGAGAGAGALARSRRRSLGRLEQRIGRLGAIGEQLGRA